jgi:hypothetical protein
MLVLIVFMGIIVKRNAIFLTKFRFSCANAIHNEYPFFHITIDPRRGFSSSHKRSIA